MPRMLKLRRLIAITTLGLAASAAVLAVTTGPAAANQVTVGKTSYDRATLKAICGGLGGTFVDGGGEGFMCLGANGGTTDIICDNNSQCTVYEFLVIAPPPLVIVPSPGPAKLV